MLATDLLREAPKASFVVRGPKNNDNHRTSESPDPRRTVRLRCEKGCAADPKSGVALDLDSTPGEGEDHMSRHTNWWTVAAASTLLATGAQADLLGLNAQLVDTNHITGTNGPAGDHYTIDIFAIMEAGDRLDAMAGDSTVQKMITCTPDGSFWQNAFGGNLSTNINPALFAAFPSLEYDSFVTIGLLDQTDNALAVQGIDFTAFAAGGAIDANNGAWFVTPDDAQGNSDLYSFGCGEEYAVRVARLTVIGFDTAVHVEGLLQGKDASGATVTLSASLDVTYASLQFEDCNSNGIDDSCDISSGTSQDSDENGVPDECQTFDCNDNGTNDADDIADGTSSDCNGNGIPDECDIADGTSSDCDGNGTPDECQSNDCNGNGIPDTCDIADGTSEDCDGDGTPDECELDSDGDGIIDDCEVPPNYVNLETNATYEFFANAIADAEEGDRIVAQSEAFSAETQTFDFNGKCVQFTVDGSGGKLPGGADTTQDIILSRCGSFNTTTATLATVYSGVDGTSRINASDGISMDSVVVRHGVGLEVMGSPVAISGNTILRRASSFTTSESLTLGDFTVMGEYSSIESASEGISNPGSLNAQGTIIHHLTNDNTMNGIGDLIQIGNLYNKPGATIDILRGEYFLVGNLTNEGTIIGTIDQGGRGGSETQPGDGMNITGDFTAGAGTSLSMPHEFWAVRVGGNIDLAINNAANFDMSLAELNATGRAGGVQNIEVMSADLGNGTDGLKQGVAGNYPLGSLVIDASSTSSLVDNHDNDNKTQADGEAIYCDVLIVDGTLVTNGYKVYANEIIINGTVSNDDDVIIIVDGIFGDINADGSVNVLDLLRVIADWGQGGGDADLNTDGTVDILDFLLVLQEWS